VEEEDEHRRHQRAATHAGEPDDDADQQAADREGQVERQGWNSIAAVVTPR
jgi:hypothetical protein